MLQKYSQENLVLIIPAKLDLAIFRKNLPILKTEN